MTKALLVTVIALLICSGCETPSPQAYQPTDGRNLSPGMQAASHGDPLFPEDVDGGLGGAP
jgi:hypothetical protein